jgi:hypothetical protein
MWLNEDYVSAAASVVEPVSAAKSSAIAERRADER